MKNKLLKSSLILMVVLVLFGSCATAIPVPPNATQSQLEKVSAMNLEVIATNTSTLAGIQVGLMLSGLLIGLLAPSLVYY